MGRRGPTYYKEMTWKCSSCGHENLGRHTDCQNCRSPKEADETYEDVRPGAEVVTEEPLLKMATAGANRTCPYCGADIRELDDCCDNCSARRDEESVEVGEFDEAEVGLLETESPRPAETPPVEPPHFGGGDDGDGPPPPPPSRWPSRRTTLIALGALAAVGGLTWLVVWAFVPREVDVTVAGVSWQIDHALRQKTLRHGEGWRSDMPHGTFNESCETRQNGTEDCNPHDCNCRQEGYDCNPHDCNCRDVSYDCNPHDCNCREVCTSSGNGFASCHQECDTCYDTCSRRECDTCYDTCYREVCDTCYDQCPVYEDWCRYDYHEWPVVDRDSTSGTDLDVHAPPLVAQGPDQRLDVSERYEVRFTDGEDTWTLRPDDRAEFSLFPPNARWRVKVNRAGQVWPVRPLQ